VRLPEGSLQRHGGWVSWPHLNRHREAVQASSKASARASPGPALIPGTDTSPPARTPHNDGVMVRVWEYDVPETSRAEFERTYGAAGDWVELFSSSDGFRGTELFVSLSDPGRYLTVDRFTDESALRLSRRSHQGSDHRRVRARRPRGRLSQLQWNSPGRVGSRIRQVLGHTFVPAKGQRAGEYHRVASTGARRRAEWPLLVSVHRGRLAHG
jgi:hypothetical protein